MFYQASSQTLVHTVLDDLSSEDLMRFAALRGGTTEAGEQIQHLALVFAKGEGHAELHLESASALGIECRALVDGEEHVLVPSSRPGTDAQGILLPILRDEHWPHLGRVISRRLIEGPMTGGPFLTFAMDRRDSLIFIEARNLKALSVNDLEWNALSNLAKMDLSLEMVQPGIVKVVGEYGSEALLLPKVTSRLHAILGASLLAIGLPKEGGFLAVDAANVTAVELLIHWSERVFADTLARKISRLPLIMQEGRLIGLAQSARDRAG